MMAQDKTEEQRKENKENAIVDDDADVMFELFGEPKSPPRKNHMN